MLVHVNLQNEIHTSILQVHTKPKEFLRNVVLDVIFVGRAIGQAVSCGLSTRRPEFEPRLGHVGFVVDRVALGRVFLVLRFPLLILIPPTAPHSSSSIIWTGTISQIVAAVPSGLSLTLPPETKKKTNVIFASLLTYVLTTSPILDASPTLWHAYYGN
jgi:hypothetical protein